MKNVFLWYARIRIGFWRTLLGRPNWNLELFYDIDHTADL